MKQFGFLVVLAVAWLSACGPTPHVKQPDLADLYAAAPRGPLPSGVRPTLYQLDLAIDPRRSRFGGTATIDIALDQPASGIWLHGQDLQILAIDVSADGREAEEGTWRDVLKSGVAWVGFPRRLGPGKVSVAIRYSAPFDVNLSGLFRVDEQGNAYALAKSESIQGRRFMPGFDEPRFKAPFDVRLTIPDTDTAIANTPEVSREPVEDGKVRVKFRRTRPLPTYLLSLAVGSFDKVAGPSMAPNAVRDVSIPLTGYTRAGKGDEIAYALMMTEPMVAFFERAFGIPYPYEKLDIIAAPQWPSGATELAAAITYRESRILFGENSGPAARRALLNIHSHELAHMWFGDLVTPPWWDDLWLKEAFASWATGIVLAEIEPDGGYGLDAISDSVSAMRLDSLESARAVREPIMLNEDIRNAYDSITYDKGLAVISMVDSYFGADIFRPALGRYLERFEDSVADSSDFFKVIGEETNEPDLTKAFRSFVEQSGLPVIQAELDCEEGRAPRLSLQQGRYKPLGSAIDADRRWTIPFCAVAGTEATPVRHCEMIEAKSHVIELGDIDACPLWIMPNADGRGYWRFELEETQWATLAVNFSLLSAGEALTALDSALASYQAGGISLTSLMAIANAGARRHESQVVRQAIGIYQALSPLTAGDEVARASYEHEVSRVFRAKLDQLAGATTENDQILRSRIESFLARDGNDEALRKEFAAAAKAYVGLQTRGETRQLTSDDFSTALAIAVQDEGRPFIDALLDSMRTIDDPTFERAAAYAIGENNRPDLTDDILEMALAQELGTRENYTVVNGQMRQLRTRDRTWRWLQINYPEFVRVIPGQRPRSTPRLASNLCSDRAVEELENLFELYGSLAPGHERALAEARENIELCVAFRKARTEEVQTYFARISPSETVPADTSESISD